MIHRMPRVNDGTARPTTDSTLLADLHPGQRGIVAQLSTLFREGGESLYLVGGIVRDLLLGRPVPNDLDFTTSAQPERTKELLNEIPLAGLYDVGERFGTIGAVFDNEEGERVIVEVTTFRSDAYNGETRHPEVVYGATIEEDLTRRDFTVNAIAADAATGELIDPFHGQADLHMGVLRAVGNPDARFQEDPLRLLRAARFVAQLGFRIDPATEAAMVRQAPSLGRISRERILGELTKLLCGKYVDHGLQALHDTGLLPVAMPELIPLDESAKFTPGAHREKDLWEHTKRVVARTPPRPVVRWAALLHDAAKPLTRSVDAKGEVHFFGHEWVGADLAAKLLRRLNADKATERSVRKLVALHLRPGSYEPDWTDSAVRRLALEADGVLHDLLDLAAADVTSARAHRQRAAASRVAGLRAHIERLEAEQALAALQSPLDGNELMNMFDRPPGRWIAEVKNHLRELVIDGELAPDDTETAALIARDLVAKLDEAAS